MKAACFLIAALVACGDRKPTEEQAYFAAVRQLDDPRKRLRALRTIDRYWQEKRGNFRNGADPLARLQRYGQGPIPLESVHAPLREKLLEMVTWEASSLEAVHAAEILELMQAPGHDDRLLRCAEFNRVCLSTLMIVADRESLQAMVPLVSGPDGVYFAQSLRRLGTRGVSYLEAAIDAGNARGCEKAINALSTLAEPDPTDPFPLAPHVLADPQRRPRALAAIRKGLTHRLAACRIRAAKTLARRDPPASAWIGPLLEDPDDEVRAVARELVTQPRGGAGDRPPQ